MHGDDVWESDDDGERGEHGHGGHRASATELDQEWNSRQSQFHTLGYRDGVEAGKESSVQEGFDSGYAEATVAGFNWGVARGVTSAFAALPDSVKDRLVGDTGARSRLEALECSGRGFSSTDALRSFYRGLSPSGDDPGVGSMPGLDRAPESHSAGVWEADRREGATGPVVSGGLGSREEERVSSSFTASAAAGESELKELEKKVRRELEVACVKICDVLVGE